MSRMPNISESFHAHLEARKAVSDELKNEAFQVRGLKEIFNSDTETVRR